MQRLFEKKDEKGNILNEIAIGFDGKNNILYVDKSRSVNNTMAPDKQKLLTSLELENNKLHLQILVDQSSLKGVCKSRRESDFNNDLPSGRCHRYFSFCRQWGHYYRPSENMGYVAAGQITI